MSWSLAADVPQNLPSRPSLSSHQSNSLPSTPYQHARELPFRSRSPSPHRAVFNTSPRSTHSESNQRLPSLRKVPAECKYETGMAYSRRRIPYSMGSDLLEAEKDPLKKQLDPAEEEKLSGDMRELYDRLLPSAASEERRMKFVQKLETLLNSQWPGNEIKVHVFGSTGNKLCTSNSDVDICITTAFKDLEQVCILADVLAKHGMERVVCVSTAKVPIVKIWDPELHLACDMNVNNTLALENTRMIKTYVDIDERVRPLAMIIKHWTKMRILNDAALGGTLSSYTWICMIINFLQTRNPPILPVLQQRPHKQRTTADGNMSSFDDDLDSLHGFGSANKETLGELLFEFFRYYGHEVDFERKVISIRVGKLISKKEKGWHLLQNNRLCVEEPFNTSRNLGNTADDTSVRGLHLELRRACMLVSENNFQTCCEQYEYPPEEERTWERPAPQPRPVLAPTNSYSARGGRGGGRGARYSNSLGRVQNTSRRTSTSSNRSNNSRQGHSGPLPYEFTLQQQTQQYLLHDHLYQQFQFLQAQEQELRIQLHQQALMSGRLPASYIRQPHLPFLVSAQESAHDENTRSRAGTINHPPLTAPVRQNGSAFPSAYLPLSVPMMQETTTRPPSPSMSAAVPDLRRNHRRSSIATTSSGGSLRAHSQPARSLQSPLSLQSFTNFAPENWQADKQHHSQRGRRPASPSRARREADSVFHHHQVSSMPRSAFVDESQPSEYVGYYVGGSPPLHAYHQNSIVSPLPKHVGLAIRNGGVSPYFVPSIPDYQSPTRSPPFEPLNPSPDLMSAPAQQQQSPPQLSKEYQSSNRDCGLLIVDGSMGSPDRRQPTQGDMTEQPIAMSLSASTSDDQSFDTPATTSDTLSQGTQESIIGDSENPSLYARQLSELQNQSQSAGRHGSGTANGVVSNGSRSGSLPPHLLPIQIPDAEFSNTVIESPVNGDILKRSRSRPYQGGEELGLSETPMSATDINHAQISTPAPLLSPVKEVRTPSPTTKRRPNALEYERVNGIGHKTKGKPMQGSQSPLSPISAGGNNEQQPEALLKKANSLTDAASGKGSPNGSGPKNEWQQTTRKKNKKGAKTSIDSSASNVNGGEPLPADESMRKGG